MDSYIQKEKLLNHTLTTSDVSNNVNLDLKISYDLGYQKLSHIKTFTNYFDYLWKDVFTMIKQLGPSTFFMTFTMSINN
jgi:hypothetical protein